MNTQAAIQPGTFIVLEGIDAAGKSTQLEMFQKGVDRGMFSHEMLLTHQPSGGSAVGNAVYAITENGDIASDLARQFLHLASHAEHYERDILPALDDGTPVIMDRCWWSTLAYGYYAGNLHRFIDYKPFETIVKLPTQGRMPDVVFLFLDAYSEDPHNTPELLSAYDQLEEEYSPNGNVFRVPKGTPEEVFTYILITLADLGLTS